MKFSFFQNKKLLILRLMIIYILASLLTYYHSEKVYEILAVQGVKNANTIIQIQLFIRIGIELSLILVMLGFKKYLIAMWTTITALTLTRFALYYQLNGFDENFIYEYISYFRGFIFPAVITLIYPTFNF